MENETRALTRIETSADRFLPVFSVAQATQRRQVIIDATKALMKKDTDYGVIPGTPKPTLLKPGAEKLCTLFGLSASFILEAFVEDWTGTDHGGEPFFSYRYKCQLARDGHVMGEGDGSCNSWESKYRWRKSERICPTCSMPAIIKGKAEYGGGWLCYAKKGGCGAKFKDGDSSIEKQETGRIANPDVFDQVNTFQKMAQKRSMIAATLIAVNASEFYTQDIEDLEPHPEDLKHEAEKPRLITEAQRKKLMVAAREAGWTTADGALDLEALHRMLKTHGFDHSKDITADQYDAVIENIQGGTDATS